MISRRKFLAGSAAAGALMTASLGGVAALSRESLVRSVLERYLGPLRIEHDELTKFTTAFNESHGYLLLGVKLRLASEVSFDIGMHDLFRRVLPGEDTEELSRYERALLAAFHVMTDYPWRRTSSEPVRFVGGGACRNPFARFD